MTSSIIFDPLLEWPWIIGLASFALLMVCFAVLRRLSGWWMRGLGTLIILTGLINPSIQQEDREPLSDIVIALIDETASQNIDTRRDQSDQALENLRQQIARQPNTELRVVKLTDGENDSGTLAMRAISEAISQEPQARIAGVVIITDGRIHDIKNAPALPAPLHAVITGQPDDWDRRLVVSNAPAFAIMGEPVTLTLRIEDQGTAPDAGALVPLSIAIDGGEPSVFSLPVGEDIKLPMDLPHGGMNVVQFSIPVAAGELTDRNNSAVIQINGVRDRLRVLLVSGEPHAGERTWRNLLKSDASVDLVHFTILRPPEKQDGVPVDELSLIAFPTRELFLEKINDFDLIIFDRYRRRGILPGEYLDNIRSYVEKGGAVLVSSGPEYGSAESMYRSPLGKILPGAPTARVFEEGFKPQITELGTRHPVTTGLEGYAPMAEDGTAGWGRWFRHVDVLVRETATIVMSGLDNKPLLMLDRVGEGRVALIASDHSWLWDRGFEGGGPQLELLRRLAHWMMKEPDLEEEALWAEASGQTVRVIRRSLETEASDVTITHPDGSTTTLPLTETSPGTFETLWDAPEMGLYQLSDGDQSSVIALGPASPREFTETIATAEIIKPATDRTGGGVIAVSDGAFNVRAVGQGRPATGRGWIGITPRNAYQTADISITALLPAWAYLLLGALFVIGAWLREGRDNA